MVCRSVVAGPRAPSARDVRGRRALLALLLLPGLAACGDGESAGADAGADAAPRPTCDDPPALAPGASDGHPAPLAAGPSEARAGRLTAAMLPADPEGLLSWREGDLVVANDRVALVVESARVSDGYQAFGGGVAGVARVEAGALVEPASFGEVLVALGIWAVNPESVAVLADGSDGGAAIVRVLGPLEPIPFLDAFVGGLVPGTFADVRAALDYVLEPGAQAVTLRFTFASARPTVARVTHPTYLFFQTSRMPMWTPGAGFDPSESAAYPFFAFVDDDGASYAWADPSAPLEYAFEVSGANLLLGEAFTIPGCALSSRDHVRVDIGGPGLDGLLRAVRSRGGDAERALAGRVTDADGSPAEGVRVHATLPDGTHLTRATVDATGDYRLHVPDGVEVALSFLRPGHVLHGPVAVAAGDTPADVALPAHGVLEVAATDAAASPVPARVQVLPSGGPFAVPAAFGERRVASGRSHVAFPTDGRATLRVAPGSHAVVVSRGYEHEIVSREVTIGAGETVAVDALLERVVDTPGVMCGDFHIHTTRSPDADDPALEKLRSAAADGLEVPVRSDHEWVRDFEPEIAELGLQAHLFGIGSIELTTFSWGHFGVFPLEPMDAQRNDGAFEWVGRRPPEVFGDVRARSGGAGPPALIVNHPRGGPGAGAYFNAAGYDPVTGTVRRPELWDEDVVLVEVFNDSDFDANHGRSGESTVRDWFSFLSAGRRVFAVGSSDSHHIVSSPVGYPRTCIELGMDDPEALRSAGAELVRDRLVEGRATVSGGIYVDARARGGVGPGGELRGAAARELLAVTVQAASWITADRLRVFVDGEPVVDVPLDESTLDPLEPTVRFRGDLEVPVGSGPAPSWAVVVASGADALEPVHPGRRPFGVTNPIFFGR